MNKDLSEALMVKEENIPKSKNSYFFKRLLKYSI